MINKKILDVTCGSRSIWFNKAHPAALYCDKRNEVHSGLWKNSKRKLEINPDVVCDFCEDARWKDDFCSYFKKRKEKNNENN